MLAEAKQVKEQLEKKKIVFNLLRRSDQTDVLLVQLQPKKIAEGLQKQFGIKVDKRHIELEHPIRAIGLIEVPVKAS